MADYLALKWGAMKEWRFESEGAETTFRKYQKLGMSFSAMDQQHTDEHKQALCELIDAIVESIRGAKSARDTAIIASKAPAIHRAE